jgi:uncharacterized protein YpuA (DUF1002 family)
MSTASAAEWDILAFRDEDKKGECWMVTLIILVVAAVVILVAATYLSRYLFKRAVRQVIMLLRERGATDARHATTLADLGIGPRDFVTRMTRARDYRPYAVQMLRQSGIIVETDTGRIYLSEAELSRSPVKRSTGIE